jgi:hypothetical protein
MVLLEMGIICDYDFNVEFDYGSLRFSSIGSNT